MRQARRGLAGERTPGDMPGMRPILCVRPVGVLSGSGSSAGGAALAFNAIEPKIRNAAYPMRQARRGLAGSLRPVVPGTPLGDSRCILL